MNWEIYQNICIANGMYCMYFKNCISINELFIENCCLAWLLLYIYGQQAVSQRVLALANMQCISFISTRVLCSARCSTDFQCAVVLKNYNHFYENNKSVEALGWPATKQKEKNKKKKKLVKQFGFAKINEIYVLVACFYIKQLPLFCGGAT